MEVNLYQVEADYIAANTGFRTAEAPEGVERRKGGWIDSNRPCPFLKDDACSIYEFRPMVCRTHMSFEATNELCRPDNPNKDRKIPQINRDTSYPGAMKAYAELAARYGKGCADIRDFFGHTIPLQNIGIFGSTAGKK
jgi:Fe-S-cluster containining protein